MYHRQCDYMCGGRGDDSGSDYNISANNDSSSYHNSSSHHNISANNDSGSHHN